MRVAIVGAGAAGCFCAAVLSNLIEDCEITIFESCSKPMTKLAVTGGGRCNLTNTFEDVEDLSRIYPRGWKFMRQALRRFGPEDTAEWFRNAGVRLKVEDNGRVFPCSDDAMEIVGTLLGKLRGVTVRTGKKISSLDELGGYDAIILTSGGGTADIIKSEGIEVHRQIPSLFSFDIEDTALAALNGIVIPDVSLGISGTNFHSEGDILVTHWGFSGPAVLKLSSYAAEYLSENNYKATLSINYRTDEPEITKSGNLNRLVRNAHPDKIPGRYWEYLMAKSGLREDIRWSETGSKGMNKLGNALTNDCFRICGKGRNKDEFVTCGGVSLSGINPLTMESKNREGLYFAGEILDIDAITGGFNLQAAWTTAYIAAVSIAEKYA